MSLPKTKAPIRNKKITITDSTGLSEDDIEQMVKDAEANADADKERRETIDVKNQLDSLIYSTEKTLSENKDKIKEEEVKEAEGVVEEAKKHLEADVAVMKEQIEKINEVAHKLAQSMYSQSQEPGETPTDGGDPSAEAEGNTESKPDDDVVDAEFEDVGKK